MTRQKAEGNHRRDQAVQNVFRESHEISCSNDERNEPGGPLSRFQAQSVPTQLDGFFEALVQPAEFFPSARNSGIPPLWRDNRSETVRMIPREFRIRSLIIAAKPPRTLRNHLDHSRKS